jgi:hypothetical protein
MALVRTDLTHEYIGRVVRIYEGSVQIMSDIYADAKFADVVDHKTGQIKKIELSVTDMGRTFRSHIPQKCTVDLSPEAALQNACYEANRLRERLIARAEKDARFINRGDLIKVTHGRTAKGAIGKVFWMQEKQYGRGYYNSRLEWKYGIALSDRKEQFVHENGKTYDRYKDTAFVWGRNVEKVGWEEMIDLSGVEDEVTAHRDRILKHHLETSEMYKVAA